MSQIGIYPKLDDLQFQKKITLKKEYRGYTYNPKIGDIKERVNTICKRGMFFELSPHQEFVKRFISFDTPYNGLLLFHGLGSGKTCSAIGITEALRSFYVNQPKHKKILIVASPKLQKNYSLQLFDPDKLVKENGMWNLSGCVGSQLLSELNLTSSDLSRLSKEEIVLQIQKIIKDHYLFMGDGQFANTIENIIRSKDSKKKLEEKFKGRVIVIDEFHNIRAEEQGGADIKKKKAALLNALVDNVKGMKLILLTGTPMYNKSTEIIYLLNILNKNDGRPPIQKKEMKEMFDKDDNLTERGKEILVKYSNGYVSFVRGENPYAFPYMVTPKMFQSPYSFQLLTDKPTEQFNGNSIDDPIKYLDLFVNTASEIQELAYERTMTQINEKFADRNLDEIESLGYNQLIKPIQGLIITYPTDDDNYLTGDEGLRYAMDYKDNSVSQDFKYRSGNLMGMFSYDRIGDYSSKIKSILDLIINSKGIVLIYSQFVYGGIVPLALALEELGFKRNSTGKGKSLFRDNKKEANVFNLNGKSKTTKFAPAKYSIISGDISLSPDNDSEIHTLTSSKNKDGELIKVVLITQAGTEGIDMKNLRQVHVMEPWYNLNRLEQAIGRARRNCSHVDLPIEERNFELYLHTSKLSDSSIETVDSMLYRIAEKKSIKIGKVTRVLKSASVDCLLNIKQQKYAELTDNIKITLSNGTEIDYSVKDEPFTSLCDYMETCEYSCINNLEGVSVIDKSTYGYKNTKNNKIIEKIRYLFTKRHVYSYDEIVAFLKRANGKDSSMITNEEIDRMLDEMIETKIPVMDKFQKNGYVVRIINLFLFQPEELSDPQLLLQDRMAPITLKPKGFTLKPIQEAEPSEQNVQEKVADTKNKEIEKLRNLYEQASVTVKVSSQDEDWYAAFDSVKKYMMKSGVHEKTMETFLISHMCDQLVLEDELSILNYLYSNEDNLDEFETLLLEHYSHLVFEKEDKKYIGLIHVDEKRESIVLYRLHPEFVGVSKEIWKKAPLNEREIIQFPYKKPIISTAKIIGAMVYFKSEFHFKTLELEGTKRISTGALVSNKNKSAIVKLLNQIVGSEEYTTKNTDTYSKTFLIILSEMLLRYLNIKRNTKHFLTKTDFYIFRYN